MKAPQQQKKGLTSTAVQSTQSGRVQNPLLSHIMQLQKTAGNQAVTRMLKGVAQQKAMQHANTTDTIQLSKVQTKYGEFEDETYEQILTAGEIGARILLSFTPNNQVNASKIGLVQSVRSVDKGASEAINKNIEHRFVKEGANKGFHIDRSENANNPIYGADSLVKGQNLSHTKEHTAPKKEAPVVGQNTMYTLGTRTDSETKKASLRDSPQLTRPAINAGQEFETTALAIDGPQKGTYYGSVKWGWETDAQENYTLKPLALASDETPTAKFVDAAKQWNASYPAAKAKRNKDDSFTSSEEIRISISGLGEPILRKHTRFEANFDSVVGGRTMITLSGPVRITNCLCKIPKPKNAIDEDCKLTKDILVEIDGKKYILYKGSILLEEETDPDKVCLWQGTLQREDRSDIYAWAKVTDIGSGLGKLPIPK